MTWNIENQYVPAGPVAAAAYPGGIAGGWIDYGAASAGKLWSINANNQLVCAGSSTNGWYDALLLRPLSDSPTDGNAQLQYNFIAGSTGALFFAFRVLNPGTSTCDAYNIGINFGASGVCQAYRVINSALTSIGVSGVVGLAAGTAYYAIASAVQTNGTTTTLTISIYNASTNALVTNGTLTVTDTNAALQYPTNNGQVGFWADSATILGTGLTYSIDTVPAQATGYTVTLASAYGLLGNTINGLINLTGGQALTAPLVVTIADASGTLTGIPVTVNSGQSAVAFSYVANTIGVHTLTISHSGGNAGMADPAAISFTTTGSNTWYPISNYVVGGGPIAASANPGALGGGWIDESGNDWSINASNELVCASAYPAGFLLRPVSENQNDGNAQSVAYFTFSGTTTESIHAFRLTSPIGAPTGYLLILTANASAIAVSGDTVISGTLAGINGSGSGSLAALTTGATYYTVASCQQISPT